jgi:hypothetical protein
MTTSKNLNDETKDKCTLDKQSEVAGALVIRPNTQSVSENPSEEVGALPMVPVDSNVMADEGISNSPSEARKATRRKRSPWSQEEEE